MNAVVYCNLPWKVVHAAAYNCCLSLVDCAHGELVTQPFYSKQSTVVYCDPGMLQGVSVKACFYCLLPNLCLIQSFLAFRVLERLEPQVDIPSYDFHVVMDGGHQKLLASRLLGLNCTKC